MATENRPADIDVEPDPLKEVTGFSFFQLVHLIEKGLKPGASIGNVGPAEKEAIRFRPYLSLGFPPADVISLEEMKTDSDTMRYRITTSFMGLYGTTSPLPLYYTENILWHDHEMESLRGFLDLFHHRMISIFYRAWSKYRHGMQFRPGGRDRFTASLFGLVGLATDGLRDKTGIPAVKFLRYAGLLTQSPRSASSLEGILKDYFSGIPVKLLQCIGKWFGIVPEQRISLGKKNCRLGEDATLGERVYGRTGYFRILIGPMRYSDMVRFLPGGKYYQELGDLLRFYLKEMLDFEIELKCIGREIPRIQLGRIELATTENPEPLAQLGWTTWLNSEPQPDRINSVTLTHAA